MPGTKSSFCPLSGVTVSARARGQKTIKGGSHEKRYHTQGMSPEALWVAPGLGDRWEWGALLQKIHRSCPLLNNRIADNALETLQHGVWCAVAYSSNVVGVKAIIHSKLRKMSVQTCKEAGIDHLWVQWSARAPDS